MSLKPLTRTVDTLYISQHRANTMITYKVRDQVCQIYNPARRQAETGDIPSR